MPRASDVRQRERSSVNMECNRVGLHLGALSTR